MRSDDFLVWPCPGPVGVLSGHGPFRAKFKRFRIDDFAHAVFDHMREIFHREACCQSVANLALTCIHLRKLAAKSLRPKKQKNTAVLTVFFTQVVTAKCCQFRPLKQQ